MKKTAFTILTILVFIGAIGPRICVAQNSPLSFNLLLDKSVYSPGEPIQVVMTLVNNSESDIITSKGFSDTHFHLFLYFTGPDGKKFTSFQLKDKTMYTPHPPPVFVIGNSLIQGDPIEILQGGQYPWAISLSFNAYGHYALTKGGVYSVNAKISMRTYANYETTPEGEKFSRIASPSWVGSIESNTVFFTLVVPSALDHIAISPSSSTIVAGNSQSYAAFGYDQDNNNLGDMTADTTFTIAPDGNCTGNSCKATVAGLHTVTAMHISGKTDTATLQVNPADLDHISISPDTATIIVRGSQAYTATGYDENNNSWDVTSTTTLLISPDGSCDNTTHTCTATNVGVHTVTGNNAGKTDTATLNVIYNYTGFLSPIQNSPTVNTAVTGSTIPLKWRITDAMGVGISDRTSFVSFTSSVANCETWATSNPNTVTSGAKYNDDGYWQYNWKTPKGSAGTCWVIVIKLKDGIEHEARFQFTK